MDFGDLKINAAQTVTSLQEQSKALLEQKAEIERQIADIDQKIEAIRFLGNPESRMPNIGQMDVKNAVDEFFKRSSPVYISAIEIRGVLSQTHFRRLGSRDDLLESIQAIIEQMGDHLEETSRPNGEKAYRLKP